MKRKIYDKLTDWKRTSAGHTALMIDGARRVGKSYIVEEFAKNEYESYLIIDFSTVTTKVKRFFQEYLEDLDTFFMLLLSAYHVNLKPGKSLRKFALMLDRAYVLHANELSMSADGIVRLPLYMTELLVRHTEARR